MNDASSAATGGAARVAFQGELGAFSEEAAGRFFGDAAEPVPHREFVDVARAVVQGEVDYGLLPIENTLAGSVVASYDVLAAGELEVVGEIVTPIHHCMLGPIGATLDGLRRVLSHPVALAQCTRFLRARPELDAIAVYDTAGAAREVAAQGDLTTAAIAGLGAAKRYGLAILAADVEDRHDNQTRFLVVVRRDLEREDIDGESTDPPAGRWAKDRGPRDAEKAVRDEEAAPRDGGAAASGGEAAVRDEEAAGRGAAVAGREGGAVDRDGAGAGRDTEAAAAGQYTARADEDRTPMKTALLVETPNTPGALVRVLLPFANRAINLSKLESRPADRPWTYRFFVELETDAAEATARDAIEQVREQASSLLVLGSYPRAGDGAR